MVASRTKIPRRPTTRKYARVKLRGRHGRRLMEKYIYSAFPPDPPVPKPQETLVLSERRRDKINRFFSTSHHFPTRKLFGPCFSRSPTPNTYTSTLPPCARIYLFPFFVRTRYHIYILILTFTIHMPIPKPSRHPLKVVYTI